jgi:predicted heme/steroid binding protein
MLALLQQLAASPAVIIAVVLGAVVAFFLFGKRQQEGENRGNDTWSAWLTSGAPITAQPKPEKPKIVPRNFTLEQLRVGVEFVALKTTLCAGFLNRTSGLWMLSGWGQEFDGSNGKPIYIALTGEVFDVSEASNFYGEGGPYHLFAGRDASRSLAKSSFGEHDLDGR